MAKRRRSPSSKKSAASLKGWRTRRAKERKRSEAAKRGWKTRKKQQREREKKSLKRRRKLVCKVLFDGEGQTETFWRNIRELHGDSIGNKLARIVAQEGICKTSYRTIDEEEFHQVRTHPEEIDNPEEMGVEGADEWETEIELEAFWSTWFDHMRSHLPMSGKKSAGSLLILRIEVCYFTGGKVPASEA